MTSYLLAQKIADDASADNVVSGKTPYMVSSIRKVLVDGEPREKMELCTSGYGASSPRIVYSKDENDFSLAGVQGGDLVQINVDEQNTVRALKVLWKNGSTSFADGTKEYSTDTSWSAQCRIKMAYAYSIRTDVLDAVSVDVTPDNVPYDAKMPLYMPEAKILKYDDRLNTVVELTAAEIKDYENFGDKRSTFIYYMWYQGVRAIFMID